MMKWFSIGIDHYISFGNKNKLNNEFLQYKSICGWYSFYDARLIFIKTWLH
jgi:peptide methionine sulfoxide reductase MsrB